MKKLGLMLLVLVLIGNSISAMASRALMLMPVPSVLSLPVHTIAADTMTADSITNGTDLPCHSSRSNSSSAIDNSIDNAIANNGSDISNSDSSANTHNCQQSLCKMLCLWQPLSATSLRIFSHAAAPDLISSPITRTHIGFTDNLLRPPKTI